MMHHHSEERSAEMIRNIVQGRVLPSDDEREITEDQLHEIEKILGWLDTYGITDRDAFERTVLATVTATNNATTDPILRSVVWLPASLLMHREIDTEAARDATNVGWDVLSSFRQENVRRRREQFSRQFAEVTA